MTAKSNVVRLTSRPMHEGVAQLFKDLGWSPERQKGFCQRQIKHDAPRTNAEAAKVYHGLEEMLKRRLRPHYSAFQGLVMRLMSIRAEMTPWERDIFLPDIASKMSSPDKISPAMIKKVREIAHKHGAPCGFPSFRELAAAQTTQETKQ